MKIESRVNTRTISTIKSTIATTFSPEANEVYAFCIIPETIDAKMRREIPLDIPFSVIISPIHIKINDPTVNINAVQHTTRIFPVSIAFPPNI